MAAEDLKTLSTQADEAGEQFTKLYYETVDRSRHKIGKFYTDSSTLLWNGNPSQSATSITSFLENLPPSKHAIESLDVQPIIAAPGQKSMLVVVSGTVEYKDKKTKAFMQNFLLTAQGTSWKIVSDSVRTFD